MKERVTLTVDTEILQQVDKSIDGHTVKNRSHAVELLLLKALGADRPKKAFVLAGGKGTRLAPLTKELPKPLIPLHDKPLLEHVIDLFKKYGINDMIISIGYKGDKIKQYFGDGKKFGINISYVEEQEPLGTAGPLKLAEKFLTETFVMCNADELKNINLVDMFVAHKENKAKATLALTTVENPSDYGVARMDGNKITEFVEKPKDPNVGNLISAGLYILEPEIIKLVLNGPCSIERDVFPKIAAEGKLFGYPFSGQWFDTGTLQRYEKAINEWKDLE
ncbi:nucleotidyltransferase family protein [Candidatus Woesearchaeota archaeon]|nr:nucleotidyltransferase family protein [Candidatus Woesearchaeota archaeon]